METPTKKSFQITHRRGRAVQVKFEGSDKWVSSGCHSKKEAILWAESIIRNKNDYLSTPVHDGFRLAKRQNRNIQVQFDGSTSWVSSGYQDEFNATLWAKAKLRDKTKKDMTLSEFADEFYTRTDRQSFRAKNERKNRKNSDFFYVGMDGRYRNYVKPRFGEVYLRNIDSSTIDEWFLTVKKSTNGEELAADSRNKILLCLSYILKEAVVAGYLDENPCDKVDKMVDNSTPRQPLTTEEMDTLFPENDKKAVWVWGNLMWACYFNVMKCTGFRPGEVAGLTIKNYYPELYGIHTTQSVDSRTREVVKRIKTTNRGRKEKLGLLTDQCCRLLDELISTLPPDEEYLFKVNGDFVTAFTANKHFVQFASRAGVKLGNRTQYSLRHTFQTAIAGSVEQKAVEELMGHTKYRQDYDHRDGKRRLEQLQDLREQIKEII